MKYGLTPENIQMKKNLPNEENDRKCRSDITNKANEHAFYRSTDDYPRYNKGKRDDEYDI